MSSRISDKCLFLWQHNYGSRWIDYSAADMAVINNAFNKHRTVTLRRLDPKQKIVVTFKNMTQKNDVSGIVQPVRCCIWDEDFFTWQREVEKSMWDWCTPEISIDLESSFQTQKPATFYFKGFYKFIPKTMTHINLKTKAELPVCRLKIKPNPRTRMSSLVPIKVGFNIFISTKIQTAAGLPCVKRRKIEATYSKDAQVAGENDSKAFTYKGKAPVSDYCSQQLKTTATVYFDGSGSYDVMLNQADVEENQNKYYHMQLLQENENSYYVFYHWGRVGKNGRCNTFQFLSKEAALANFAKKFYSKTKNKWNSKCFIKVDGMHNLVSMDYEGEVGKVQIAQIPSKLNEKVKFLMELFCDVSSVTRRIRDMSYDLKQAPGKLSQTQISAGLSALKTIENIITTNRPDCELLQACNEFYTCIPHDFGMKRPPVINTLSDIQEKMKLLEILSDIEISVSLQNRCVDGKRNCLDILHDFLECNLEAMDSEDEMYQIIRTYFHNTHGPTHNSYEMKLIDIFNCQKSKEDTNFKDLGNNYLLWHGSRLTNFVGILSKGLQIAPPEAPSSGYMFGKGIYFADVCSKSANYNYPTILNTNGILLLCEVSLGNAKTAYSSMFPGKVDSVGALGKYRPDPSAAIKINDLNIPQGQIVASEDPLVSNLIYNEYVVYETSQVKLKYLVHFKFDFKSS